MESRSLGLSAGEDCALDNALQSVLRGGSPAYGGGGSGRVTLRPAVPAPAAKFLRPTGTRADGGPRASINSNPDHPPPPSPPTPRQICSPPPPPPPLPLPRHVAAQLPPKAVKRRSGGASPEPGLCHLGRPSSSVIIQLARGRRRTKSAARQPPREYSGAARLFAAAVRRGCSPCAISLSRDWPCVPRGPAAFFSLLSLTRCSSAAAGDARKLQAPASIPQATRRAAPARSRPPTSAGQLCTASSGRAVRHPQSSGRLPTGSLKLCQITDNLRPTDARRRRVDLFSAAALLSRAAPAAPPPPPPPPYAPQLAHCRQPIPPSPTPHPCFKSPDATLPAS
ncbi:uncharacterized protein LOC126481735 [Schistocerca serialis cubense]|uniref:uncharacterized protein LOC126481735 n=1 Tax=Schistocerca serialis cubense TaxID=2023355 RepID=UPI00214E7A00|nr:uncharacterized protein LOC126481735 [Schistocerca serialis cubense]